MISIHSNPRISICLLMANSKKALTTSWNLIAVSRDINSVEKIATGTKLNNEEVQLILNDLLTQRLIVKIQKKGFIFGKKKVEMGITAIGMKLLSTKKQELEEQKQQMHSSLMKVVIIINYKAIWMLIECGCQ